MTPDQIAAMIPEEVVETVACLLCRERHPCWSIVQEVMELDVDGQGTEFRRLARAAIAAGLAKWPDVASVSSVRKLFPDCLILPLTAKENGE